MLAFAHVCSGLKDRHTSHDVCLDTRCELASTGSVNHSLDGTSTVGGDDVEGAVDASAVADLGKGGTALVHGGCYHGDGVLALAGGLAQAVGGNVGLCEDGGVDFGDLVPSGTGNDTALDANGSAVAASITGDSSDLAVGRDQGRSEGEGGKDNGVGVEVHDCWEGGGWRCG